MFAIITNVSVKAYFRNPKLENRLLSSFGFRVFVVEELMASGFGFRVPSEESGVEGRCFHFSDSEVDFSSLLVCFGFRV